MKKIFLLLTISTFFSFAQAEYILTSPLTGPKGIMDDRSIIMKQPVDSTVNETSLPDTCDYNRLNGLYWMVVTNEGPRQVAHVSWNGTTLYDYNEQPHINDSTEIVFNGVTYKRGEQQMVDYYSVTYSVCKVNN